VLIPADPRKKEQFDGLLATQKSAGMVRCLSEKELVASRVASELTAEEWRFLRGVASLKIALAKQDNLAIDAALSLMHVDQRELKLVIGQTDQRKLASGTSTDLVLGLLATSYLAAALKEARLVYWLGAGWQLRPGLFCPDFKTAVAVHLLLHDTFRVCPRCDKTFVVTHPTQQCCSIQCREAHRIARWRATKRQEKNHGSL